jgi:hypothetical protein
MGYEYDEGNSNGIRWFMVIDKKNKMEEKDDIDLLDTPNAPF